MFWFLNLKNRNFTNVLFMITLFHWWNLPNSPIHFEISRKRKVVKINSNFRKYFSVDQKTCLTYVNSSANPTALSQALHWSFEDFIRKIKSHRYQFKVQITTLNEEIQFCMSYKSSIVNTHTLRKEELCKWGWLYNFRQQYLVFT